MGSQDLKIQASIGIGILNVNSDNHVMHNGNTVILTCIINK